MTVRGRSPSSHLVFSTPGSSPTRKNWADDAYWLLSSESVSRCLMVGIYCFVGCLTRVHTDTSACNSTICSSVETRHPQNRTSILMYPHCTTFLSLQQPFKPAVYGSMPPMKSLPKPLQKPLQVNHHSLVLPLPNLPLLIIRLNLEYQATTIDLHQFGNRTHLLSKRRSPQVAHIYMRPHRHIPLVQVSRNRAPGCILH